MAVKPSQTFIQSDHPNRTWRITMAQNRVVIICRLPLQTVGKGDIQQHLVSLDIIPTLTSDTLVSRAEPPPFGWTDIVLEKTFEYWNRYRCTKANCLIMQSLQKQCNVIMKSKSDTAGYKSCEYK